VKASLACRALVWPRWMEVAHIFDPETIPEEKPNAASMHFQPLHALPYTSIWRAGTGPVHSRGWTLMCCALNGMRGNVGAVVGEVVSGAVLIFTSHSVRAPPGPSTDKKRPALPLQDPSKLANDTVQHAALFCTFAASFPILTMLLFRRSWQQSLRLNNFTSPTAFTVPRSTFHQEFAPCMWVWVHEFLPALPSVLPSIARAALLPSNVVL
jgi:hypothetical protein